jgi:hypothetical protein
MFFLFQYESQEEWDAIVKCHEKPNGNDEKKGQSQFKKVVQHVFLARQKCS